MGPDDHDLNRTDPLSQGLQHFNAVEPDHEQAVYWFSRAADAGDLEGLALLAFCQLEGLGLPRDVVQARGRLESAAAHGSLLAQFHLGRALVSGWGGEPDAARGVALYQAAAARGHADATFNLAACLDAGWGCQPDRLAAKALFLRARALGSPLKAPGLRVRERELGAVRELARRLEDGTQLAAVLAERQQAISRMHELRQPPARRAMRQRRQRLQSRLGRSLAMACGVLASVLAALFPTRGSRGFVHDSGPTSIA
jgi:hypothetical protein